MDRGRHHFLFCHRDLKREKQVLVKQMGDSGLLMSFVDLFLVHNIRVVFMVSFIFYLFYCFSLLSSLAYLGGLGVGHFHHLR